MQTAIVEQEDMRKPCDRGLCLKQPPLAVLPVNESTLVPFQPCRTRIHVFLRKTAELLGEAPTHAQMHTGSVWQGMENRTSPSHLVAVDFLCVLAERDAE